MSTIPGQGFSLAYHKSMGLRAKIITLCMVLAGSLTLAAQAGAQQLIVSYKPSPYHSLRAGHTGYVKVLQANPADIKAQINRIQADPSVARVEIDHPNQPSWVPNDPLWSKQQQLPMIGLPDAWNYGTGLPVTVAVIDSGIDLKHPDLKNSLWTNPGEIPGNKKDDDHNGYVDDANGASFIPGDSSIIDGYGHGTHVSGIIAGELGNRTGIAGIAPNAKIMALRVFDDHGLWGMNSSIIQAIDYAWQNGARVINLSLGCQASQSNCQSFAVSQAIDRAQTHGVLVVAAAGNEQTDNNQNPTYPASYSNNNILSVASVDGNGDLSSFSNWGADSVDLAAPGRSILSTVPQSPWGQWMYKSGTSMSTPEVAAAAAWLWGLRPDRDFSAVRSAILNGTTPDQALQGKTTSGGYLNLPGALQALDPGVSVVGYPYFGPKTTAPPTVKINNNTVSCSQGSWNPKPSKYYYQWLRGGQPVPGQSASQWNVTDGNFSQPIQCQVRAENADGSSTATSSPLVLPAPKPTVAPKIMGQAKAGNTLTCTPGTWLYQTGELIYSWSVGGNIALASAGGNGAGRYQVAAGDAGKKIVCSIKAINSSGQALASASIIAAR